jgi:hypothetical protein
MDGKSRWIDNEFIERLWRSIKLRGGVPACLWQRDRSQSGADPLPRLLQFSPFSSVPRPPHARRGVIRRVRGNDSGDGPSHGDGALFQSTPAACGGTLGCGKTIDERPGAREDHHQRSARST